MIEQWKDCVWKNFGASIDMLINAIKACPEVFWHSRPKFFYNAYHCVVFLDYYLSIPPHSFTCPLPFTPTDWEKIPKDAIDDVVPDRLYSKEELLNYAKAVRIKCRQLIEALPEQAFAEKWIDDPDKCDLFLASNDSRNYSVMEILFYNMRHTQHHAAQLNLYLRQWVDQAPDYVSQAAG